VKVVRQVRHLCNRAWIISANRILSAIFAVTDGEGLISSRFSRTAAMKEAAISIAAFGLLSLFWLALFSFVPSTFRRSGQVLLGDGCPLNTSVGLYRKALQQQEQLTTTSSRGGGSDFVGSERSSWGSTARQVIVQLHFLHLTTHAAGSPEDMPIMAEHRRRTKGEYHSTRRSPHVLLHKGAIGWLGVRDCGREIKLTGLRIIRQLGSILSLRCTTSVLLEYCPDGHLSTLRPSLLDPCGLARRRGSL
jgi:hypothetical protein